MKKDATKERFEERDGQIFRVVTLPPARPRRKKKALMSKRTARSIAIAKKNGKKMPQVRTCTSCKRPMPMKLLRIKRAPNGHKLYFCSECRRSYKEHHILDDQFRERVNKETRP